MTFDSQQLTSHWPHRLAVLLVCATFPLIWVGGLVTSYDAGMAVPDWPSTYGYNLFLYPWQTWLTGPWDTFVEHGHRLLGAAVGLICIALVIAVWACDARSWVRWFSVATLVAVILQGGLGGARVLMNDIQLARLHGCTGPLFFCMGIAMAVFTSRWWFAGPRRSDRAAAGNLHVLVGTMLLSVYLQLVLGAHLRHLPADATPSFFRAIVLMHLLLALVVTVQASLLVLNVLRSHRHQAALVRPAVVLGGLVLLQLLLGAATWVVKYSWPSWFSKLPGAAGFTIEASGLAQALIATAHVAVGSLILGFGVLLGLRVARLLRAAPAHGQARAARLGVAA